MNKNEQLDAMKFLVETHRALHEKRQRYEWRIIFAMLTFFVASVGAVYSQRVCLPEGPLVTGTIWGVLLTVAFLNVGFLRAIHTANGRNKSFAEFVEKQIMALINKKKPSEIAFSKHFRKTYWAFYWQSVLTIVLAIAAAIMLTCSKPILANMKAPDAQMMQK